MHLRDSAENISKVCEGFLAHPLHLQEHFLHLTEVNISEKIERGLVGHLGETTFSENIYLFSKIIHYQVILRPT